MTAKIVLLGLFMTVVICQTYTITKDDKKLSLDANVDTELVFEMDANETTGFSWYLITEEKDYSKKLIALNLDEYKSSSEYIDDAHPPGFVGYGGKSVFRFKPLKAGLVKLVFEYKQPWMPTSENEAERDLAKIDVKIKAK